MIKVSDGLPLARPVVGSSGQTGTWRVLRPVVHFERCTKCRLCFFYCVENTIDLEPNMFPKVDYQYCKGCGVCAQVCPTSAIEMVREVK